MEALVFQRVYKFFLEKRLEERGLYYTIEEAKRGHASKTDRILRIQPYLEGGRIVVVQNKDAVSEENLKELKYQLDRFPYGAHDDILDVLTDAVAHMEVPGKPRKREDTVEYVSLVSTSTTQYLRVMRH